MSFRAGPKEDERRKKRKKEKARRKKYIVGGRIDGGKDDERWTGGQRRHREGIGGVGRVATVDEKRKGEIEEFLGRADGRGT